MPDFGTWKDVPTGYQNEIQSMVDLVEQNMGYAYPVGEKELLSMARTGVLNEADVGQWLVRHHSDIQQKYPWINYGLDKDTYQSYATTFSTEYKKITGQDIPADQMSAAFNSVKDRTGGILSGSEYAQQLQNDANIQKQFGWVRYGLDFNQFQQQKLQMRQAFGKDLTDQEGVVQLQYLHAGGQSREVQGAQQQQRQPATAGQSVVR